MAVVIFNQAYEIRQWKPHRHEAVRNRPEMVRFQPVEPEADALTFQVTASPAGTGPAEVT
jgi:hypothetical protein